MSTKNSDVAFTEAIEVFLSPSQKRFLSAEVARRRAAGETSSVEEARGNNANVNMGMLIRESIEAHFKIALEEAA